ncbi:MAG: MFS transporter [Solirubrobacterales bacterium]|nr:MFS transporter [Solirubrobacterales bacterium]
MTRRQKLTLILLLGTQSMLAADFSVFNVALPSIGANVGISLSSVEWIATAFALPTAGFTLFFGRVADLVGRRRLFSTALLLLIVASLAGGLAHTAWLLLAARVIQGLATAATIPSAFALLVAAFPEGPLRERALGLNGSLLTAGFTTGALLGGVLTSALSWRWAFLFNVPVALLILLAAPKVLAESRGEEGARLDTPGAVTVTGSLLALVFGIVTEGDHNWTSSVGWICIAVGLALGAVFFALERRSSQPLVPLGVLARPTVALGNLGGFTVFAMETSIVFVLTLYLQRILHYSALDAGFMLGGPGAAAFISGMVAPRTLLRFGPRTVLAVGLMLQGLANIALLSVGASSSIVPWLLAITIVSFFVHVHALVGFTVTATSGLPDSEQGLATSLLTMTQQVAIASGIPVIGTIATAGAASALLAHIRLAFAVDAGITVAVAAVIGVGLLTVAAPAGGLDSQPLAGSEQAG